MGITSAGEKDFLHDGIAGGPIAPGSKYWQCQHIIVATESQRVDDKSGSQQSRAAFSFISSSTSRARSIIGWRTGLTVLVAERVVDNDSKPLHLVRSVKGWHPCCSKRVPLCPHRCSNEGMSSMEIATAGASQFQHNGSKVAPRHQFIALESFITVSLDTLDPSMPVACVWSCSFFLTYLCVKVFVSQDARRDIAG